MEIRFFDYCTDGAKAIRVRVFMDEQGFCEEFDEIDNIATHLVAFDSDTPIATCRVFKNTDGKYQVGRLAVIPEYRGKGIGEKMLAASEDIVAAHGGDCVLLHSQCRAQGFYAKCGFVAYGEIDYDEDCPHVWMKKSVAHP